MAGDGPVTHDAFRLLLNPFFMCVPVAQAFSLICERDFLPKDLLRDLHQVGNHRFLSGIYLWCSFSGGIYPIFMGWIRWMNSSAPVPEMSLMSSYAFTHTKESPWHPG